MISFVTKDCENDVALSYYHRPQCMKITKSVSLSQKQNGVIPFWTFNLMQNVKVWLNSKIETFCIHFYTLCIAAISC